MKLCVISSLFVGGALWGASAFTSPQIRTVITGWRLHLPRTELTHDRGRHANSLYFLPPEKVRDEVHQDLDIFRGFINRGQEKFHKICACALVGFLLLLPPCPVGETVCWPLLPSIPPASAETVAVAVETKTTGNMVADADTDGSRSSLLSPLDYTQDDSSLVDETWTLIDKYFIDRTFNGQDWTRVREKYRKEESRPSQNSLQLAAEMTKSLGDKYSRILDPKAYGAIQKFDLIGVGATLTPNEMKQIIVGAPPIAGSAADKAGIKVGDFVVAVNGRTTDGRTSFDIIDQISENPNAKTVTFTIRREGPDDIPGEGQILDVTLGRQIQEVKDPIKFKIQKNWKDGRTVGYIRISEFNTIVKGRLEEALVALSKQGANAYVLDLRGNPGGAFQSAVEISSLFYEDRVATYVIDSKQVELPFKTTAGHVLVDEKAPIAIWIDGFSASASEVLAGSMHDNCKAVVMGDRSFGKGLIQAVYGLKNGAGLVLTVAQYITPNGSEIQGLGIKPDLPGGVPPLIPGLLSDTSNVDFDEIDKRLRSCSPPSQR